MRTLLFAAFILLFMASCATSKLVELTTISDDQNFNAIDFTKYSAKGFLLTPEKYMGEYTSVGIVRYVMHPSATYKTIASKPNPAFEKDKNLSATIKTKVWDINDLSIPDVIDGIYLKCKLMGADALVNLEIKADDVPYTGVLNPVTIRGYVITGFAIKRK